MRLYKLDKAFEIIKATGSAKLRDSMIDGDNNIKRTLDNIID